MVLKNTETARFILSGIVQGIGFRPFLFNLLSRYPISGEIKNSGNLGVILDLQFDSTQLTKQDISDLIHTHKPPMARLEEILVVEIPPQLSINFKELSIKPSDNKVGRALTLPPDIAMCESCLQEFKDSQLPRFYHYPFLACVQCGPRFTIMRTLPYDRENSSMRTFPFCQECQQDYNNRTDRRFHAQTFCCNQCGPQYTQIASLSAPPMYSMDLGQTIINHLAQSIREGKIVAIKGIGGLHIVCRADRESVIKKLRKRKRKRKYKPFAVMMPDLEQAHKFCRIPLSFESLLTSYRRPIILFPKIEGTLPSNISPGLPNLGILLPYMGLHYLLFEMIGKIPLVFTSGNPSDQPMAIQNTKIQSELEQIVDEIYVHNRVIEQRCDDSVLRPVNGVATLIRRSRGYVPEYITLPFEPPFSAMISVGAELNNTGAIARFNRIFPTQHIGNIRNLSTYQFLRQALNHLIRLLKIPPEEIRCIVSDQHPEFLSRKVALEMRADLLKRETLTKEISARGIIDVQIQHHHAHLAALMVDHQLPLGSKIVAITVDGVGFGEDKEPWGGEILLGSYIDFNRKSYLHPMAMVGGDQCAKYPIRMLLCILLQVANQFHQIDLLEELLHRIDLIARLPQSNLEYDFVSRKIMQNFQRPKKPYPITSSLGRLLDSCAALVRCCDVRSYRGEPAMRLEGYIWNVSRHPKAYSREYLLKNYFMREIIMGDKLLFDYAMLMYGVKGVNQGRAQESIPSFARAFVEDLAFLFAHRACKIALQNKVKYVGITGGVAYNDLFVRIISEEVKKHNLHFLQHLSIPPGDAGISIGQIAIAAAREVKKQTKNSENIEN